MGGAVETSEFHPSALGEGGGKQLCFLLPRCECGPWVPPPPPTENEWRCPLWGEVENSPLWLVWIERQDDEAGETPGAVEENEEEGPPRVECESAGVPGADA